MKLNFKQIIICTSIAVLMVLQGFGNAGSKVNELFQFSIFSWLLIGVLVFVFALAATILRKVSVFWIQIGPIVGSCFVLSAIITLIRAHQVENLSNVSGFAIAAVMFGVGIIVGCVYKLKIKR